MISYEAAPNAKVFIKGSEVFKDSWRQESIPVRRFAAGAAAQVKAKSRGITISPARCFPTPTIRLHWPALRAIAHGWTQKP